MSVIDIAGIREEYLRERLDEADVKAEPIAQFRAWFDEAVRAQLPMANAMTLATTADDGRPSARVVLLKGVDERGFVFFTDYRSRKARELESSWCAALLFYWIELEREVRIEGTVERVDARESADYFAARPLGSRLAALASHQSSVIASRPWLEQHYAEVEAREGDSPQCPPTWGGYRVLPDAVEFWQGRSNRLHDRLLYRKARGAWQIVRLSP
jgi:pyridoxamine 5'-phosphate oxidase